MKLTYIYHSGFALEAEDFTMIFDFYRDSEGYNKGVVYDRLLKRKGKLYVLASHSHPDHFNSDVLLWKDIRPDIKYIFSRDILENHKAGEDDAVYLSPAELYRDNTVCIQAYGSTDLGCSFLVEFDGKSIFHAGDLNNWHWSDESTPEESQSYEADYLRELEVIARMHPSVDLVMFPVDPRLGRDYMRGAEQFVCRIAVKCFSPMHFGKEYEKAAVFRPFAEENGALFISWTFPGERVDVLDY